MPPCWVNSFSRDSRSEERFSRNAETEIVCRLLLEKKIRPPPWWRGVGPRRGPGPPAPRPAGRRAPPLCGAAASAPPAASAARDGARVFFFNDTATTEIYTLSLHDALPI